MVGNVDVKVRLANASSHKQLEIVVIAELSAAYFDHLDVLVLDYLLLNNGLQVYVYVFLEFLHEDGLAHFNG